jgi:hypothetical protein
MFWERGASALLDPSKGEVDSELLIEGWTYFRNKDFNELSRHLNDRVAQKQPDFPRPGSSKE